MPEGAMQEFLTNVGVFFTQSVDWMGNIMTEVTTNPALTVLVLAMPIVG